MAGKKKKDKKPKGKAGKAKGKSTTTDGDAEAEVAFDKNVAVGEACFRFRNRDHYVGGYRATRTPMDAVREGAGTYRSKDGHVYAGTWARDALLGEAEAAYPDGSRHQGLFEDNAYHGHGVYSFGDGTAVRGDFDDRPLGELLLTDPGGQRWVGQAEAAGATFLPENRFLPREDVTNRFHRKASLSGKSSLRSGTLSNGVVQGVPSNTPLALGSPLTSSPRDSSKASPRASSLAHKTSRDEGQGIAR